MRIDPLTFYLFGIIFIIGIIGIIAAIDNMRSKPSHKK